MRATNLVLTVGLALTSACATGGSASHGVTYRDYVGSVQVIFTNATPQKMCELHISYDDQRDFGDNWLPDSGLASGKSIEFKVKPGKYKATWNTCPSGGKPYFAGTLIGEAAVDVDQQTQLFTYVADTVAPTKRAPAMGRDYKVVKFSGQEIGVPQPVKVDAFAAAEQSLSNNKSSTPPVKTEVAEKPEKKFSAKEMVDPKAKRTAKREFKPSLSRKRDIAASNAKYQTR